MANSLVIEQMLVEKKIELGLVEGTAHNSDLKYSPFVKDEIVLVSRPKNSLLKKRAISLKDLTKLPLLTRETGSGTSEIIEDYLQKFGIKMRDLNIHMQLGSTESIKNYLLFSDTFAFLSVYSVKQDLTDDRLCIIDIDELEMTRTFSFVTRQGQPSPLSRLFVRFCSLKR